MTATLTPHGLPLVNGYGPWRDPAAEAVPMYDETVRALGYGPHSVDERHQIPGRTEQDCTGAYTCPGPHIEGCWGETPKTRAYARERFTAPTQPVEPVSLSTPATGVLTVLTVVRDEEAS